MTRESDRRPELELRHLRLVLSVAEEGSLGRAAARLGVSQSTVSRALTQLEEVCGARLFERTAAGVEPTAAGREVLRAATGALRELDALCHRTAPAPGPVRVGCASGRWALFLRRRLQEQSIEAEAVAYPETRTVPMLESGALGMLLTCGTPGHPFDVLAPEVRTRSLPPEPLHVAVHAGHRLAGRDQVGLAELAGETWLLPGDGEVSRAVLLSACRERGFFPDGHTVGEGLLGELLRGGVGLTLASPVAVGPDPDVVLVPLREEILVHRVVAWRSDQLGDAAALAVFAGVAAAVDRFARASTPYQRWLATHPEHCSA